MTPQAPRSITVMDALKDAYSRHGQPVTTEQVTQAYGRLTGETMDPDKLATTLQHYHAGGVVTYTRDVWGNALYAPNVKVRA